MAGAFRKSGASMASKMKNRDRAKTDYERVEAKKGGKMKKKKSFPDMSGDGKVTKKDILIARGVIKKPMKKKK